MPKVKIYDDTCSASASFSSSSSTTVPHDMADVGQKFNWDSLSKITIRILQRICRRIYKMDNESNQ